MPRPLTLHTIPRARVLDALAAADDRMAALIARVGPYPAQPKEHAPFRGLFRAIVYQQLSGQAASTILGRVLALYGDGRIPAPEAVVATPPERLRGAGLSRAKAAALHDLAARTLDGTVPTLAAARTLDDETLIERLVAVRGVGRWTAEMLLMSGLGRPDVLPVGDLGIRKGFQLVYRTRALPPPERVAKDGRRWAPYRTVASWYLWRSLDE